MRKGPILGPRTLHHSPWLSDGTDQPGRTRATVQLQEQSWGHTESPSATKPPGCLSGLASVGVCPPWLHVGLPHLRAPLCLPVPHGKKGTTRTLGHGTPLLAQNLQNGRPFLCHPTPNPTMPPCPHPPAAAWEAPVPSDHRGHYWAGCPGNKAPFSRAAGSRGACCQCQHCLLPAWHCQPRHLTPW